MSNKACNLILAALLSAIFVGCKHPLKIAGQGDIVDIEDTGRGCSLEQQAESSGACTENNVTGDYVSTYLAVARAGWYFSHWQGTGCQSIPRPDMCAYNIPESWVALMDQDYPDFELPPTTAVFKQIAGSSLTQYGWIDGRPQILAQQLEDVALYKDPTQIPPDISERDMLLATTLDIVNSLPAAESYSDAEELASLVSDASGISSWLPILVVRDFRTVPYLAALGLYGAVAYHDLMIVDGKFVDVLLEYSTYLALMQTGDTDDRELDAVDNVTVAHLNQHGSAPALYYPFNELTDEQKELALFNFLSGFAALLYHEFGHLYLYHSLDTIRANSSASLEDDARISRTPVSEDDADISAGILLARASLEEERGRAMLDLLTFFVGLQTGEFTTSSEVVSEYRQTLISGSTYSSLQERKKNLSRGYAVYEQLSGSSAAAASATKNSISIAELKTTDKAPEAPFSHSQSGLQIPLSSVRRSLRTICHTERHCTNLLSPD